MAEPTASRDSLTVEEYMKLEENATVRHEYVAGEIHAMTGATRRHNRIAGNIYATLLGATRGSDCRVYMETVKLRAAEDTIYYPDLMVACGPDPGDPYVESEPCLVVEVVSTSTDASDRREKLAAYKRMPGLRAYLIVSQDQKWIRAPLPRRERRLAPWRSRRRRPLPGSLLGDRLIAGGDLRGSVTRPQASAPATT